jgi:iron complex outermembrane receptor protein
MSMRSRLRLTSALAGGIFTTALMAAPALAQTAPAPAPQDDASVVEEVVVTGTRIRLQDYAAANPVTSVTSEAIETSGNTNLTSFLTEIPALAGSLTLQDGADTSTPQLAGLNLLNLRNLGTDRTLVLVNGRRHVASSPGTSSVDVNAIPTALVERVEVLTGGASAVYGADGVSGVVNFILKKDFEGTDFRAQRGVSDAGGGDNSYFSLLIGQNFLDKRANLTFGFEFNKDDPLKFSQRDYTRTGNRFIFVNNPDDPGTFGGVDDPNLPDLILANNARYIDTSRGGSVYTNFNTSPNLSGVSFLGNGQPFVDGVSAGGFIALGGSGTPLDDFNDDLLPGLDRQGVSLTGNFQLTPKINLFGEFKYTRSQSQFFAQPSYFYGLFVPLDNPYIPANVVADSLTPGGLGETDGAVLLARDNFDLGTQNYDILRETVRAVFGAEGDITDNIRFEASVVYGKAKQRQTANNVIINDRVFAASDVTTDGLGNAVCRSNLDPSAIPVGDVFGQFAFPAEAFGATFTPGANSGCLPLNLFGEGLNSQAALDWITGSYTDTAVIDQTVVNAFISGDSTDFFELPAGPIAFVLGAEYRRETSDSRPSDIQLLADDLEYPLTGVGRASRTEGKFDVAEVFTEISVPLLRDLPFVKLLSVSGAYRYSDYSTSGGADTWNVNGRWQLNDSLAFRGTKARAVRAPNIVDLFQGRQQTFAAFADPCSVENLGLGENPTLRQQNCATALTALGVNPATFINNSSESVGGFIQGNPDLQPETADTYTLGLVATPTFLPGFSLSFDYYDINIDDAIQAYTAQTIVNNCYDLPNPNNFCALISRGTVGGNAGRITGFSQVPGNLANYATSGYDMTIRYALDPARFGITQDIGQFNVSLIANKLDELTFTEVSGATPVDSQGRLGAPDYTATLDVTWQYKAFSVNYGFSYFSETDRYSKVTLANEPDIVAPEYLKYPAREVHDVQARFDFNDQVSVYGGVNNLSDEKPAPGSESYPVSALGRFFYAGVNIKL